MDEGTSRAAHARRPLLLVWAPVVGWAGLIFFLSSRENLHFAPQPLLDFVVRKLGHMGVFGILALLLRRAFGWGSGGGRPGAWVSRWAARWAFVVTALYAASDELHQAFVPTRGPSVLDVGIDCLGAVIALVAVAALAAVQRRSGREGRSAAR